MNRSFREIVRNRLETQCAGPDVLRWDFVADIDYLRAGTDAQDDGLHCTDVAIMHAEIGRERDTYGQALFSSRAVMETQSPSGMVSRTRSPAAWNASETISAVSARMPDATSTPFAESSGWKLGARAALTRAVTLARMRSNGPRRPLRRAALPAGRASGIVPS